MKKTADKLQQKIEEALNELLSGKSIKTDSEREELRSNIRLAMQWKAIEAKLKDDMWGSGFTDGKGDKEDAGLDDD